MGEVGRNKETSVSEKEEMELVDGLYIFPFTPHSCGRKKYALMRGEKEGKE